jgi:hypothetical protein
MTRLAWRRRIAKASRWLHIYGSMGSLALVLFFTITGITLNHQEWFADQQATTDHHGTMAAALLRTAAPEGVDKLSVVEALRSAGAVRGAVSDFRTDDAQCEVVFKGPGYEASAVIDRATGRFDVTESRMGFAAVINDLHKGRDTVRSGGRSSTSRQCCCCSSRSPAWCCFISSTSTGLPASSCSAPAPPSRISPTSSGCPERQLVREAVATTVEVLVSIARKKLTNLTVSAD